EELNGKILDIKSSGKDLYLSSKNNVYGGYDFEEMLETSKDIKSMFFVKDRRKNKNIAIKTIMMHMHFFMKFQIF
ncbi:MAG: hypothetical protein IJY53_05965, partial [Akkermansia sp.]|nr:hypothetical protein [Akkermansia sp.]